MSEPAHSSDDIIRLAAPALVARGLDPHAYHASMSPAGKTFIVIFQDRRIPFGARGIRSEHPTLEVEVDPVARRILRSYFAR